MSGDAGSSKKPLENVSGTSRENQKSFDDIPSAVQLWENWSTSEKKVQYETRYMQGGIIQHRISASSIEQLLLPGKEKNVPEDRLKGGPKQKDAAKDQSSSSKDNSKRKG